MRPLGKISILIMFIICIIAVFIAGGIFIIYNGENYPNLKLVQRVQDEYSVPVNVKVINDSGNYMTYLIPEKVRWDKGHRKLLYNLSDPKETVLAYIEAVSNYDGEAVEILMSPKTRDYWKDLGYDSLHIIESYRSRYKGSEGPYRFEFEEVEEDPSERMLTVKITGELDSDDLALYLQPDGTWRI